MKNKVGLFGQFIWAAVCLAIFVPLVHILAMGSSSYQINADSVNFTGDEDASSGSYELHDTGGEIGTGDSTSGSYFMRAGYQAMTGDYSVAINCNSAINMGAITGTGQSNLASNEASCTVQTDNPAGYSLTYSSAVGYMENQYSDVIPGYTPSSPGTPEAWSVPAIDSEWGARLKREGSTTYDTTRWGDVTGTEDYFAANAKWHNVTTPITFTVVTRDSETTLSGDTEIIQFGAEVGSSHFQPTGTYDVDVVMTAITL